MINDDGNKQYLWSYAYEEAYEVMLMKGWVFFKQTFSASVLGTGVPEIPVSSALGGQVGVWGRLSP